MVKKDQITLGLLLVAYELSNEVHQQVEWHGSLSPLTLLHPIMWIIVTEQIYRAMSLINGHPYHRA